MYKSLKVKPQIQILEVALLRITIFLVKIPNEKIRHLRFKNPDGETRLLKNAPPTAHSLSVTVLMKEKTKQALITKSKRDHSNKWPPSQRVLRNLSFEG